MTGKSTGCCAALVLAFQLLAPAVVQADPLGDCPCSSYSPCHYHFPLLWKLGAHLHFHWHAASEPPPPFSGSFYEYRSHCPYAEPAALLGFPSIIQRSKLDSGAGR
jgi:hypothetical protein